VSCTRISAIFIACLVPPIISGCSNNANRLALSNVGSFSANQGALLGSFTVGEVTGGTVPFLNPAGVSSDEYKEALTLSLRANHLLAADPMTAKYRIDATVDFDHSGIFDKQVDARVDYRLSSNATHDVLLDKTIHSTATTKSPLKEKAGVVVALLFTSQSENEGAWEATYLASARENLAEFFAALAMWTPPASTVAPKTSETSPRRFVIPSAVFPNLSSGHAL
jgi:hypothetical protein